MDTALARQQMVRQQVRTWDVFDQDTLAVLNALRRDEFAPAAYAELAYADTQIPLPHGQVMMAPKVEGRVLQALDLKPSDRVLEIGTGSGFLAACLARLSDTVLSVDIFEDLLAAAATNLENARIENVDLQAMDAIKALPNESFDAIAVTGSLPEFDGRFAEALKPGGRLFVIVGNSPVMRAQLIVRQDEQAWRTTTLFETSMPPLINARRDSAFSF